MPAPVHVSAWIIAPGVSTRPTECERFVRASSSRSSFSCPRGRFFPCADDHSSGIAELFPDAVFGAAAVPAARTNSQLFTKTPQFLLGRNARVRRIGGPCMQRCPSFRNQQVCLPCRQVEHIADRVVRQVDAVEAVRQLPRQPNPHRLPLRPTTRGVAPARPARDVRAEVRLAHVERVSPISLSELSPEQLCSGRVDFPRTHLYFGQHVGRAICASKYPAKRPMCHPNTDECQLELGAKATSAEERRRRAIVLEDGRLRRGYAGCPRIRRPLLPLRCAALLPPPGVPSAPPACDESNVACRDSFDAEPGVPHRSPLTRPTRSSTCRHALRC